MTWEKQARCRFSGFVRLSHEEKEKTFSEGKNNLTMIEEVAYSFNLTSGQVNSQSGIRNSCGSRGMNLVNVVNVLQN